MQCVQLERFGFSWIGPRKGGVAFFPSFRFRFDCGQRREDVNDSFSTIDMRMWIEYPSLEAYFCHLSLALLLTVIISRNVTVIRYQSVIKVCLFRENTRVTGRPATIFLERTLLPPRRKIAKIVAISWHRIVPRDDVDSCRESHGSRNDYVIGTSRKSVWDWIIYTRMTPVHAITWRHQRFAVSFRY